MLLVLWCAWACTPGHDPSTSKQAPWSIAVKPGQLEHRWRAGDELAVAVELENRSARAWPAGGRDRLSYHWLDSSGEMLIRDGARTLMPHEVAAGQNVRLRARVVAPDKPGRYRLRWAMVREGVRWYPSPEHLETTEIEVVAAENPWCWSLRDFDLPSHLPAGSDTTQSIVVENCGRRAWAPDAGDRFAYHWWSADGALVVADGRRSDLPSALAPEQSTRLDFNLRAPAKPGEYILEIEALREGKRWHGPPRVGSSLIPVTISRPPPPARLAWYDTRGAWAAGSPTQIDIGLVDFPAEPTAAQTRLELRWSERARKAGAHGTHIDARVIAPLEEERDEAIVQFRGQLRPPKRAGEYTLTAWLHSPGRRPLEIGEARRQIAVGPSDLSWALVEVDAPRLMAPGEHTRTRIVLRNTGTVSWSRSQRDALSHHWLDDAGSHVRFDGLRTQLPRSVAPGETIELQARVQSPRHSGLLRLQWDMVREGVRWQESGGNIARAGHWIYIYPQHLGLGLLLAILAPLWVWALRWGQPRFAHRRWAWLLAASPIIWAALSIAWACGYFYALADVRVWKSAQLAAVSAVLTLLWPYVLAPARHRRWVLPLTITLAHGLVFADLLYFHFFGGIVPVSALGAVHQVGHIGPSIASLVRGAHAWLLLLPLASVAFLRVPTPSKPNPAPQASRIGHFSGRPKAPLVCLWILCSLPAWVRWAEVMPGRVGRLVYSETRNVARLGLMGAHAFDILRSTREFLQPKTLDPQVREALSQRVRQRSEARQRTIETAEHYGEFAGHNLLLIQVEALQEFVLDLRVEGQEITPYLNRIHGQGVRFPRVVDQTAEGKTSDAEYLVLNAQHPLERGAVAFLRADRQFDTMAHVLARSGYSTFSSHPFERSFWNRARLHPAYGFDDSRFRRELGPGLHVGWGLADGLFFERVIDTLEQLEQPWFSFLITLSLHHPYDHFPSQLEQLDLGPWQGSDVGNYLHAMHYFDRSLQALMQALAQQGLADRTLVALYGDHDARFELESRPELHGLLKLEAPDRSPHMRSEFVPFAIIDPRTPAQLTGKVDTLGGQIDIGPTLLHLLGVGDRRPHMGRSLLTTEEAFAAYPDGSAYGSDQLSLSSLSGMRAAACLQRHSAATLPSEACDALQRRARDELRDSRMLLDYDLVRAIMQDAD